MKENIFLIGFSGTGKTSTGKILAERLGYDYIDTDLQIEANTGQSVPEIFAQDGEEKFRQLESEVLEEICKEDLQIVATGGGIVLSKENRTLITSSGYVVCLEARTETIYVRLLLDTASSGPRPLLSGSDPYSRITNLKNERQPLYAQADWTVHTDFLTPEETADQIEKSLNLIRRRGTGARSSVSPETKAREDALYRPADVMVVAPAEPLKPLQDDSNLLEIKTGEGSYKVVFGAGLIELTGQLLKEYLPDSAKRKVFVISDSVVAEIHGATLQRALEEAGYRASFQIIPSGEQSKTLAQTAILYDWLANERAERKDIIIALGGGVVGDLGGFVASSWLRGVPLVHIPTTLLAMVDSSIGGKTGVNLPQGKNLVGAIYPPQLVISDVGLLHSLPKRERRSGWAEVIKHAIIPGADPGPEGAHYRLYNLENNLPKILAGDTEVTSRILRESVAVKAGVVQLDERESDLRMTLNYGHTYAHALESGSNYSRLLHGEAVAIGMHGVALLAQKLGYCDAAFVERQKKIILDFGFALTTTFDPEKALSAIGMDKKNESGSTRWIIPHGIGRLEIRRDIPPEVVKEILLELLDQ